MAASRADKTVCKVTTPVSTRPLPIVAATAVPHKAPIRLHTAARHTACRGLRTRVETTVAMAFAAS